MKYSIHIGVNKYSPIIYGYGNDLNACVSDADDMWCLAEKAGVYLDNTVHLIDEQATVENFKKSIIYVSNKAVSGDTFILTYSSHGTQVYDANGDEPDTLDEAICMHNGIIYDDEVSELLSKFKKGVLIIIYADTCHSESQFRLMNPNVNFARKAKFTAVLKGYHKNNKSSSFRNKIVCKVIEFAACKSNTTALDGQSNGYFTEHVLKVINSKQKSSNSKELKLPRFRSFINDLTKSMGETQIPALTTHNIPRWNNPKNIVNIMINMPEYFNNWLYINDFAFKMHSLKNNIVQFESKKYRAIITNTPMCRIESKMDPEILFIFKIPRERKKFYELLEIVGKTLGITVTQDVA